MNTDVNRKAPRPEVDAAQLVAKLKVDAGNDHEHVPVGTEDLLHHNTSTYNAKEHNLQSLENRIKKCRLLI